MNVRVAKVDSIREGNKLQHGLQADYYTSLLSTHRIHRGHKLEIAHAWALSIKAMLQQGD